MAAGNVNEVDGTRINELGFHDIDELQPFCAIKRETIVTDKIRELWETHKDIQYRLCAHRAVTLPSCSYKLVN